MSVRVHAVWHRTLSMWRLMLIGVLGAAACARGAYVRTEHAPVPVTASPPEAVPAGTLVVGELRQPLSTNMNRPGDRFTVELLDPLVDQQGNEVIGRGAVIEGVVVRADHSSRAGNSAGLDLQIVGFQRQGSPGLPISAEVSNSPITLQSGVGREVLSGLAGAAVGAGAGIAIDKDRSGVVLGSALIGAGVGALLAYVFGSRDAELPAGSIMTLRMTKDLQITPPVAQRQKR